ncbi:M81 family metallopeptidase, partial [Planococcus sp. SIMBA_160]
LHANISDTMAASVDTLIAYRTNPHVDQAERAVEAARHLLALMAGETVHTAFLRLPIVPPTVTLLTAAGPYADMINFGQAERT